MGSASCAVALLPSWAVIRVLRVLLKILLARNTAVLGFRVGLAQRCRRCDVWRAASKLGESGAIAWSQRRFHRLNPWENLYYCSGFRSPPLPIVRVLTYLFLHPCTPAPCTLLLLLGPYSFTGDSFCSYCWRSRHPRSHPSPPGWLFWLSPPQLTLRAVLRIFLFGFHTPTSGGVRAGPCNLVSPVPPEDLISSLSHRDTTNLRQRYLRPSASDGAGVDIHWSPSRTGD